MRYTHLTNLKQIHRADAKVFCDEALIERTGDHPHRTFHAFLRGEYVFQFHFPRDAAVELVQTASCLDVLLGDVLLQCLRGDDDLPVQVGESDEWVR